mmetsp:Transcript_37350/g.57949  ORF Transcript_37350/g.57949 Transcript_37350/m.57949 type:complete len:1510 (+) Transcript_37350:109-4638(+)
MSGGFPTVSFLEIDGKVLSGEEFEEYCRDHGLCRRCARVRTHRRVLKLFGRGQKWEPLTLHDDMTGEYLVYKGYCLKPTCYTVGQAKRLLGEGAGSGNSKRASSSRRQRLKERFQRDKKRPGSRKPKANPETGSVMSGADDYSISSDMSGLSQMSGFSAMSGMSGMSGFSFRGRRGGGRKPKRSSSSASSSSSVSSNDFSDDDTIDTAAVNPPPSQIVAGEASPIVSHRVEQLVMYDYFTVLDLSKVELRPEDIDAVVVALGKSKTLESVTMDKCKLKDEGVEKVASGLKQGNHLNLKKISLRQNSIGNKGAQALDFLLRGSPTLEELDLSENSISSRGAAAILTAFHENSATTIQILNLSQNEIWDMDDGSFLGNNKTLKVLNLDGNFMHDEGAEQIAKAMASNRQSVVEKLFLGWNGISDEGATALAKMMEENSTLQVLGLAENDISNTGARAILSALAVNTSVREISGLYHNQIDRKFIIVAIKRLLHRYGERTGQPVQQEIDDSLRNKPEMGGMDAEEKAEETAQAGAIGAAAPHGGDDDDKSQESTGSINWAAQLYSTEDGKKEDEPEPAKRTSVALEAIEHWDWGTFGIEEIEAAGEASNSTNLKMAEVEPEPKPKPAPPPEAAPPVPRATGERYDRLAIFQSAPLAYFDRTTTDHHEVPILDFDYEAAVLKEALTDPGALGGADIELLFENATTDRFNVFFSQKLSPAMHISCHGHPDCLAFENGFGYMQALPAEDLKRHIKRSDGMVKVVFVSSCYPEVMAKAFLDAGVPHVISVQREAVFRDEGPTEFAKAFYKALAQDKTVKEAFKIGFEFVQRSPLVKTSRNLADRYKLLPRKPELNSYHNVKVFYQRPVTPMEEPELPDMSIVPSLPQHFVGREVDMYEILESLRVDDVIRVGGEPGIGKKSVLAAVSRYVLERPKSFLINDVFWLPAPKGIIPEEDTLYHDLCEALEFMVTSEDDVWDEEEFTDIRERIMIELEEKRTILVIDGRIFTTEAAGENLERFLSHLLNEVSVKIILITAFEGDQKKKRRSRSQETIITVNPLSYKSTSLLFGNSCQHISTTGNPMVHTAEEFSDFLVPPSIKRLGAETKATSRRRDELFERMGKGIPIDIMDMAASFSEEDLGALLRYAQRPEVQIESASQLEAAIEGRTTSRDKAVKEKNYLRAKDLTETLDELAGLKNKFPSVKDLLEQEKELKKEFTALLRERKYDDANAAKRKILALKKIILKEKHSQPDAFRSSASGKLAELQAQMDKMVMAMQNLDKSVTELDTSNLLKDDSEQATFSVFREEGPYELKISTCAVEEYRYDQGLSGLVLWTNESCDVSMCPRWQQVLEIGGAALAEDINELPTLEDTTWGAVKCAMGEAVRVGPRSYGKLMFRQVVLAVSPLPPTNDDEAWDGDKNKDEDGLHYLVTGLRASYRSSFRQMKDTALAGVGIPMITTKEGGATYEPTLRVGLQTVLEESKLTGLQSIHLIASSGKEATALIKMALEMGLKASKFK